jgi:hypothetical protein
VIRSSSSTTCKGGRGVVLVGEEPILRGTCVLGSLPLLRAGGAFWQGEGATNIGSVSAQRVSLRIVTVYIANGRRTYE